MKRVLIGVLLGSVVLAKGCIYSNFRVGKGQAHDQQDGGQDAGQDGGTLDRSMAEKILETLGVVEATTPPPAVYTSTLGTQEQVDPAVWQPLKTPSVVFFPRSKVFQVGAFVDNYWNTLIQDAATVAPYSHNVPIKDDQSWEQVTAKTSLSADLDGDGLAEAIVFYVGDADKTKLHYRILKSNSVSDERSVIGVTMSGRSFGHWEASARTALGTSWFPFFSCTKADVNGDGKSEILLVDYDTVRILSSDEDMGLSLSASRSFSVPVSSVAAGDIDGDRKDEFAIGLSSVNGAQYALYDSNFLAPIANPEIQTLDQFGEFTEVTFGDFKGNHLEQLALSTPLRGGTNAGKVAIHLYDFKASASATWVDKSTLYVDSNPLGGANTSTNDYFRMLPRALDLNGTGKQQLHVLGKIFTDPLASANYLDTWSQFVYVDTDNTVSEVHVGDIDADGKQDLFYLTIGATGAPTLQVMGIDVNGSLARKQVLFQNPKQFGVDPFGSTTAITVGNFEDNAPRVHYIGHKLAFTDPIVIAVLAAAPYFADVAEADSTYKSASREWLTTFGTVSTAAADMSHAVGFSVSPSIQYDHQIDAPIFGFAAQDFLGSAAFTSKNSWEWQSAYMSAKAIQGTCLAADDCVIFTSVPVDEYEYHIDYSTVLENEIDKSLFISIPRSYSIYQGTRDFYNASIGEGVVAPVDIGQTVGKPTSYRTSEMKDMLMLDSFAYLLGDLQAASNYQVGPQMVLQPENSTASSHTANLQITIAQGNSGVLRHDFSTEATVESWSASAAAGFSINYIARSSTAAGTQFGGTLGYLEPEYFFSPSYRYTSGLFVMPALGRDGKFYWLVNYWFDPSNPWNP